MRSFSLILFFSISTAAASNRTNSSWGGKSYDVVFTHCGSGSQCGGHQKCSNYELALSDAYLWNDLGISKPVGVRFTLMQSEFSFIYSFTLPFIYSFTHSFTIIY